MRSDIQPELSVVVTSRNDDHGGNLLHRMQVFVDAFLALSHKYQLACELVVVEWNPPRDVKRLADELVWPTSWKTVTVRFIEVTSEQCDRLPDSDRMPLPQFEAKNVGIRRARGRYILATNFDILYTEQLIAFLASGKLSQDCFYRVDRYDLGKDVPLGIPVEEQLKFCEEHVVRIYAFNGEYEIAKRAGAFQFVRNAVKLIWKIRRWGARDKIHTNACGDFTLMAKQHWHNLRGYPEIGSHAYVDGLICYMAASMGLRQVILNSPMRVYHQEHNLGFSELAKQPHAIQRRVMDYQQYRSWCINMLRSGQPKIFNDEKWGLGYEDLAEHTIID